MVHRSERDDADHLMKNKYAVSIYNLSILEKNVADYQLEIKRRQRALKKFSSEGKKQRLSSELLHYKAELEKAEKEMGQLRKVIDRRAKALTTTRTTKTDVETWISIKKFAEQELANQQMELVAMQEELVATRQQMKAVKAASSRVTEELFEEEMMEHGSGCCIGIDSYFGAFSSWFAVE